MTVIIEQRFPDINGNDVGVVTFDAPPSVPVKVSLRGDDTLLIVYDPEHASGKGSTSHRIAVVPDGVSVPGSSGPCAGVKTRAGQTFYFYHH